MFERRLKFLLIILAFPAAMVITRLVYLQVICGPAYRQEAESLLDRSPRMLPCLRGTITDRDDTPLAYNAPAWEICVPYEIIAKDVKTFFPDSDQSTLAPLNIWPDNLQGSSTLNPCWQEITDMTGIPTDELMERGKHIVMQVVRIKASVSRRLGVETKVAEEVMAHPVVKNLSREQQVEARLRLSQQQGVTIQASNVRKYAGGEAVGHFLGLLREVGPEEIENDPNVQDELKRYKPGDQFGFCGLEAVGEQILRGRRGRVRENILGEAIEMPIKPQDGGTLRLTIDLPLQRLLYDKLASAVAHYPYSTGGAAVILDIASRQVLAMVSYPSFDPNLSWSDRLRLAEDQRTRPTSFRVVGQGKCYPPGSTVKPMILAAALTEKVVGCTETITCRGYLLPDFPDRWRCTAKWGHGPVGAVFSIQHSCNVYYYEVGQRMGVPRLAYWVSQFGLGQSTGLGLPDEQRGKVPQDGEKGDARNMAIGQGELEVTPIQAANMIATIASERYQPVSLWLDAPDVEEGTRPKVPDQYWRIVRQGLYEVVNKPGGTAYKTARLSDDGGYVLLGKTGSAEAPPAESVYSCRFPDGRVDAIRAPNMRELLSRYPDDQKPQITHQQPAANYPTHGWFIGYTAPSSRYLEPITAGKESLAIAVVIEYAGHGGEVAAPIAHDMIRVALLRCRGTTEAASE